MNTQDENYSATIDGETQLKEYIAALERLLKTRDEMLEVIPPCPIHGNQCVPHALEWIEKKKDERKLMNMDEIKVSQDYMDAVLKLRKWYQHQVEEAEKKYHIQLKKLTEKLVEDLTDEEE